VEDLGSRESAALELREDVEDVIKTGGGTGKYIKKDIKFASDRSRA